MKDSDNTEENALHAINKYCEGKYDDGEELFNGISLTVQECKFGRDRLYGPYLSGEPTSVTYTLPNALMAILHMVREYNKK